MTQRRRLTAAEVEAEIGRAVRSVGNGMGSLMAAERKRNRRRAAIMWAGIAFAALVGVVF